MNIAEYIRDIPDFPKEGIIFKDITPLLACPQAMQATVDMLVEPFKDLQIDVVTGIESRGFIFGALVAQRLNAAFVPIRKPGKLPYYKISKTYELEYGTDSVEIHSDAIKTGQKVLMVDDLLATGGTMHAGCQLVQELGGEIVSAAFVVDLLFLNGTEKLNTIGVDVFSLLKVS